MVTLPADKSQAIPQRWSLALHHIIIISLYECSSQVEVALCKFPFLKSAPVYVFSNKWNHAKYKTHIPLKKCQFYFNANINFEMTSLSMQMHAQTFLLKFSYNNYHNVALFATRKDCSVSRLGIWGTTWNGTKRLLAIKQ